MWNGQWPSADASFVRTIRLAWVVSEARVSAAEVNKEFLVRAQSSTPYHSNLP
jgi:hypothetical protein